MKLNRLILLPFVAFGVASAFADPAGQKILEGKLLSAKGADAILELYGGTKTRAELEKTAQIIRSGKTSLPLDSVSKDDTIYLKIQEGKTGLKVLAIGRKKQDILDISPIVTTPLPKSSPTPAAFRIPNKRKLE
jgi:hypothetical protein